MLAVVAALALLSQSPGLLNGRFEQGLTSWSRATYGAEPTVTTPLTGHRAGSPALTISSEAPTDTAFGQDVPVAPGQLYRLTGWIRSRNVDGHGAPVFAAMVAQNAGGAGNLAATSNHGGTQDWAKETVYFVGPASGRARVALFLAGWGRGTGTVSFSDIELEPANADRSPIRITKTPLPGRINPMQYGQFIEYLCDLVPSMWAEKLYDGSFEGLTPYKFVFVKETDFKEKPWYPFGERNRLKVDPDTSTAISGPTSKRITLTEGGPATGGVAQDGVSVVRGGKLRFSVYVKGTPGRLHVALLHGDRRYSGGDMPVTGLWTKVSCMLDPSATDEAATFSITFDGPGTYWLDSASLMPVDSVGGWRTDVVTALKNLKPGVIRVGGSVLDDANLGTFEWKDTIGDPDRRTPFTAWGGLQPTGPGLEEVVRLIQAVGAEPLICVRYEKKTPKDAADEIEYFNGSLGTPMGALRAKNGHPKPYGIKYWQVGNERWGESYWNGVPAFCRAMRAADPRIKLLSSFPSAPLIKGAAADLDYVSPHQYEVANLSGTRAELEDVRRMIRENAGGKPLKLGVTEWNTTAGDAGLMRAKLWTLDNALACARYQNLLHREADLVEIANRSNLTNSFCSGIIQTDRSRMFLTPVYYAQQLYASLAGTIPLRIDSELPGDLSPDVSATLSEDGKTLTLFAVNESPAAVRRPVDFSAFAMVGTEVELTTLTDTRNAGHGDAANSFEEPNRIVPTESRRRFASDRFDFTFPALSLTVMRWHLR